MISCGVESSDIESIMQWFKEGIEDGEIGILVYPNLQTFRQIYTQYVKDQLLTREEDEKKGKGSDDNNVDYPDDNNTHKEQLLLLPRIILIATFYDTVNAVKHNLSAVGVRCSESHRRRFLVDSRCI